ncbi:MAG: hypothetical protein IMX00_10120 [Limnochordales bacterium]|nr:hypothetical protein [Limnochordales bacterium]
MVGNLRQRSGARGLGGIGLFCLIFLVFVSALNGDSALAWANGSVSTNPHVRPEFFPVESVRAGLQGYGYTVISGTQVVRFPVEVLGLVKRAGPAGGDLVLVRVGGAPVEAAGGIAAGMSGSPVFVGDQLLGAIGYGFELADPTLGLVTPAVDMAKLITMLEEADAQAEKTAESRESADVSAAAGVGRDGALSFELPKVAFLVRNREQGLELKTALGDHSLVFAPVATPVFASGLGQRSLERLRQGLARYPVEVRAGWAGLAGTTALTGLAGGRLPLIGRPADAEEPVSGSSVAEESGLDLPFPSPGQALAVQLVRGDVDISALGTITWVEGDKLVGFGHPFLNKGVTRFFLGPAYVVGTVPSLAMPFRIGYPLEAVGTLGQDRSTGVAGRVGVLPPTLKVEVKVREKGKSPLTTRAEIVWDEELTGSLVAPVLLQAVDRALDRIGSGMATMKLQAKVDGISSTIVRTNLYVSRVDIAAAAVQEAVELVELVARNQFRSARVSQLNLDVEVTPELRSATIESVRAPSVPVRPKQKIELQVVLRPFRGEPETRVLVLTLPEDLAPGPLTITVRGGSSYGGGLRDEEDEAEAVTDEDETAAYYGEYYGEGEERPQALEDLLNQFAKREKNNDLVAEFWPESYEGGAPADETGKERQSQAGSARQGQPASGDGKADGRVAGQRKPIKVVLPTPYVIDGWIDVDLEVAPAEVDSKGKQGSDLTERTG